MPPKKKEKKAKKLVKKNDLDLNLGSLGMMFEDESGNLFVVEGIDMETGELILTTPEDTPFSGLLS